jgi:glyoxylase-like metal-dependent hydrolase (beta-lactamase superfamily II)
MIKKLAFAAAAFLALTGLQAPSAPKPLPELSLWRLDCGNFVIKDFNAFFSDTMAYAPGKPKDIVASCYLIKNGSRYMLWDTGLEATFIAKPQENAAQRVSLRTSIVDQLKKLGVRPDQIEMIGISHYHFDHLGQAASFPKAKLVIGKGDLDALKAKPTPPGMQPDLLKPWIGGGGKVTAAESDVDLFHDGRVIMLKMPGHTPGHNALLVKLASGNVLLTGDLYHFTEQVLIKGVPPFNTDRADTLASMDRFDKLARNLQAKVIIQHEPADIAKLPPFPQAAR